MPHYPFAHRGNVPFSAFPASPLVNPSTIAFGVWSHNIPAISGFSKYEILPADAPLSNDIANIFHDDYPPAAATLSLQTSKGPQHPGTVRYQYDDETLPDANWQFNTTNRVISIDAQILPSTLRPRRRNTEMVINVRVIVGISVSMSRIDFTAGITTGSSRTYQRTVTEPIPPTFSRRNHPRYRDYPYTLVAGDITFDSTPGGSESGTIPSSIRTRSEAYRDAIVAAIDTWEPIFTLRLFAMPYGVSQSLTYVNASLATVPKVSPGPLF